jgi:hypothetical protein
MVKVYRGKGEHSVLELEQLVEHYKEQEYQKQLEKQTIQAKLDKAVSVIKFYGEPDNMCDNAYDNRERTLGLINDADFSMAEWVDKTTGKTHSATHYGKVAREFLAEIGKG